MPSRMLDQRLSPGPAWEALEEPNESLPSSPSVASQDEYHSELNVQKAKRKANGQPCGPKSNKFPRLGEKASYDANLGTMNGTISGRTKPRSTFQSDPSSSAGPSHRSRQESPSVLRKGLPALPIKQSQSSARTRVKRSKKTKPDSSGSSSELPENALTDDILKKRILARKTAIHSPEQPSSSGGRRSRPPTIDLKQKGKLKESKSYPILPSIRGTVIADVIDISSEEESSTIHHRPLNTARRKTSTVAIVSDEVIVISSDDEPTTFVAPEAGDAPSVIQQAVSFSQRNLSSELASPTRSWRRDHGVIDLDSDGEELPQSPRGPDKPVVGQAPEDTHGSHIPHEADSGQPFLPPERGLDPDSRGQDKGTVSVDDVLDFNATNFADNNMPVVKRCTSPLRTSLETSQMKDSAGPFSNEERPPFSFGPAINSESLDLPVPSSGADAPVVTSHDLINNDLTPRLMVVEQECTNPSHASPTDVNVGVAVDHLTEVSAEVSADLMMMSPSPTINLEDVVGAPSASPENRPVPVIGGPFVVTNRLWDFANGRVQRRSLGAIGRSRPENDPTPSLHDAVGSTNVAEDPVKVGDVGQFTKDDKPNDDFYESLANVDGNLQTQARSPSSQSPLHHLPLEGLHITDAQADRSLLGQKAVETAVEKEVSPAADCPAHGVYSVQPIVQSLTDLFNRAREEFVCKAKAKLSPARPIRSKSHDADPTHDGDNHSTELADAITSSRKLVNFLRLPRYSAHIQTTDEPDILQPTTSQSTTGFPSPDEIAQTPTPSQKAVPPLDEIRSIRRRFSSHVAEATTSPSPKLSHSSPYHGVVPTKSIACGSASVSVQAEKLSATVIMQDSQSCSQDVTSVPEIPSNLPPELSTKDFMITTDERNNWMACDENHSPENSDESSQYAPSVTTPAHSDETAENPIPFSKPMTRLGSPSSNVQSHLGTESDEQIFLTYPEDSISRPSSRVSRRRSLQGGSCSSSSSWDPTDNVEAPSSETEGLDGPIPETRKLDIGDFPVITWKDIRTVARRTKPKYKLAKDLPHTLQDHMNAMNPYWRAMPMNRFIFEANIIENTMDDEPDAPPIHVINDIDEENTPPWEFHYSNHMWHGEGVPGPDLLRLVSCDCEGACDPKSKTCACLKRQRSVTQEYTPDFAYNSKGLLATRDIPIFECNDLCGCGNECMNRVVQRGRKCMVNIGKTYEKGWGVFAGAKKIPSGTFVGIYAGELLTDAVGEHRGLMYNESGRTYLFDIDFHHLKHGNEQDWETKYVVDAYHAGNFTRFLNHSCDPNCTLNACYINDSDIDKPLLAVFTQYDVEPGEELCFSYSGPPDENALPATQMDTGHESKSAVFRSCQCGAYNCTGTVFT